MRSDDFGIQMMFGDVRPVILGWDIAGTVVEVGSKVSHFKVGDTVFGMINFPGNGGAYAEYVAADQEHLALIPAAVSFEEAAAAALAALTALQVLENRVKKGDRVLIHAGAGGVGHFAIQMAKNFGAYVITTSSVKNKDFVLSLGANEHIDYKITAFQDVLSDIDFVLDGIGGATLMSSVKVIKEGGAIISLPSPPTAIEEALKLAPKNATVAAILVHSSRKNMLTLANMMENGLLKAAVYKTFALADMAAAHLEVEAGRTVGKVIVTV